MVRQGDILWPPRIGQWTASVNQCVTQLLTQFTVYNTNAVLLILIYCRLLTSGITIDQFDIVWTSITWCHTTLRWIFIHRVPFIVHLYTQTIFRKKIITCLHQKVMSVLLYWTCINIETHSIERPCPKAILLLIRFTSTLRGIIAPSEFTVTIQLNLPYYDDLRPCGLSALRNDPR